MNPFGVEHSGISKAKGAKQGLKLIQANAKAGRKGLRNNTDLKPEAKASGGVRWVDDPETLRRRVANSGQAGNRMGQGWKDRIKRAQTGDMD
mgnify:CR=1 FL=1